MPGLHHVVLNVAAYSVLWAEERRQVYLLMFVEKVRRMSEMMVNG
jgi:hypothetical protein